MSIHVALHCDFCSRQDLEHIVTLNSAAPASRMHVACCSPHDSAQGESLPHCVARHFFQSFEWHARCTCCLARHAPRQVAAGALHDCKQESREAPTWLAHGASQCSRDSRHVLEQRTQLKSETPPACRHAVRCSLHGAKHGLHASRHGAQTSC